jgi:hypothetical protein
MTAGFGGRACNIPRQYEAADPFDQGIFNMMPMTKALKIS